MWRPKHASSCIMVAIENQHHQKHHDELQTHLLEEDRQQDVAVTVPAEVCNEYTTLIVIQYSVNVYNTNWMYSLAHALGRLTHMTLTLCTAGGNKLLNDASGVRTCKYKLAIFAYSHWHDLQHFHIIAIDSQMTLGLDCNGLR